MNRRILSVLVANLFVAAPSAFAQDAMEWSGSASIGARHVDSDARDPSKLNEYRDLEDGTAGILGFELRGRSDNNYLNAYGENLGRDDQYLDLKGGRYNTYKYRLYGDELRHNFGAGPGALSPYSGIGGPNLTATFPSTNVATWNGFNHSYSRRDVGGMFEWQSLSPWYFRADANEVRREGVNVFAGAQGTSPGNGFVDLPSPIEYKTRNYAVEAGYSTKRSHVSVNLSHSTFENENDVLRWSNGFFANGLDTTILPPDNELTRLAINGNLRQLPLDSTLAARYTYSTMESDVAMQQNMLSTGATNPATNPSDASFKGDHKRTTFQLSLASRPTQALDTKLYWNYDKLKNDSTEITFAPAVGSGLFGGSTNPIVNCANVAGSVCEPERFHYTKDNLGAEAGYRLSRENKLLGGLDYTKTDRERADFPRTKEWRLFGEWKTSSLESVTARFKYQYLQRRSDFEADASILAANPMDLYVRRFDLANVNQNLLKAVVDWTAAPLLDVGAEVILKRNRYQDTPLGRTDDERQEFYGSVGWGDPNAFRVLLFGDIEYTQYNSNHRNDGTNTGNPDPATPPTPTVYNWSARNKDKAWQVGLGTDWAPRTRLKVKSSLIYAQTNGTADFSVQPGGATTVFQPITNFDNTRRFSFTLRSIYELNRQFELTAGYSYESYRYSDIGYDNTRYVAGTGTSAAYTTGQFAFQPYSANIVYGIVKYKF